jgi:hypothetical protein
MNKNPSWNLNISNDIIHYEYYNIKIINNNLRVQIEPVNNWLQLYDNRVTHWSLLLPVRK